MNFSKIRIMCLAGFFLVLVGAGGLFTTSGRTRSAQAIGALRDNALFRGIASTTLLPQPTSTLSGTSDATVLPVATSIPNANAFVALQQGCKCADVVLVVDDTSSMGPAITNVDAGMTAIIGVATSASGGDLRMGVVTFKDTVEVDQPLTTNTSLVASAVSAIAASGGGTEAEASDEALKYAVSGASACSVSQPKGALGTFRPNCFKIIVIVTDARPGGCDSNYADGADDANAITVANLAKTNGIIISSILVDNGSVTSPAHPGGVEDFVMNSYATITNGKFTKIPSNGTGASTAIQGFIKDATPPSIVCPGDITRPTDPGKCTATVNYTLTSGDNCPGVTVVCNPPSGSAFVKGTTMVNCTASDTSNNTASCSFKVTVADTEKPVPGCPTNITQPTDPGLCSAVVNYSVPVTDNCPGATVTCLPASGSTFQKGSTTVNCTAVDAAGNTASCSFPVIVVDTEKPKITCPQDIKTTSCGGTTVISYPTPAATDNCPGVTVACVPPSDFAFPTGTTAVTCTATDASGNTSSCSFNVTIDVKTCDTICFYSPQYYLMHLNDLPNGQVLIGGVNYNSAINTNDIPDIKMALQGNALGYGTLTELQQLNQEFVAAQLSAEGAANDGGARMFTVNESPLHAWGLNLVPVPFSNGFVCTRDTLLKELFAQARSAIFENRKPDMVLLAGVFDLLNGNDLIGNCGPNRPKADLAPMTPNGFASFCAFSGGSLRVTIKNQGDVAAPASTTAVTFGATTVNVPTPPLLPNQSVDLDVAVPLGGSPPVTITITADAASVVIERNRVNNIVTLACP
jgi:uncharacterized protein YegL